MFQISSNIDKNQSWCSISSKLLLHTNASAIFIFYFISIFPIYIFSFYYQKYIKININRNIICLFLYVRTICCLVLREEHKLRVLENTVLREIFVAERNWETVDCRRVHSGELHGQYCWLNVTGWLNEKVRCVGAFGRYRGREGVQSYLGRAEWKKAFGRTGHR